MRSVYLLTFGKIQTPGLKLTEEYFTKLLSHWTQFKTIELKGEKSNPKDKAQIVVALKKEALKIEAWLDRNPSPFFCLSETGKPLSTLIWAKQLQKLGDDGYSNATFIIGSSFGLDQQIMAKASGRFSLGPQTLSHDLARVVLVEQLYRAFCVNNRHPYHHQ